MRLFEGATAILRPVFFIGSLLIMTAYIAFPYRPDEDRKQSGTSADDIDIVLSASKQQADSVSAGRKNIPENNATKGTGK